jgi:hypothetical protein
MARMQPPNITTGITKSTELHTSPVQGIFCVWKREGCFQDSVPIKK